MKMSSFAPQIVNEETENFSSTFIPVEPDTTDINPTLVPWDTSFDVNNNTNAINHSLSALSSPTNQQGFPWNFNWYFIVLFSTGLLFLIVLLGASIWYLCTRTHRIRRRHSLPLAINDFIETSQIQDKHLSTNPSKPPPIPPRPTAYTTVLGKVEYRSNL